MTHYTTICVLIANVQFFDIPHTGKRPKTLLYIYFEFFPWQEEMT